MDKEWRSESFKNFVEVKERQLDDLVTVLEQCKDKVCAVQDFFMVPKDFGHDLDEHTNAGLIYILIDIRTDLELAIDEMSNATKEDGAEEELEGKEVV